jgi:hypothetical protein
VEILSYYLVEGGFSTAPSPFINAGIGTWDAVRRTAVLTEDISQTIIILIDNVSLRGLKAEGTKPVISNTGSDGISILSRKNINISNLEISNNNNGISCDDVSAVSIRGNSIHDNIIGIKFDSNNTSNSIQNNEIFNNSTGIDFYLDNSANILENNCIYDNYEYGINFFQNNNSNIIKGNKITNDGHGIYLALFNNSNSIMCNDICNNSGSSTGLYLDGDNNTVNQNNFVDNCTHAVNNGNNNSFDGNYWHPCEDCTPYSHCGVVDKHPCNCISNCGKKTFKQISVEENLTIPEQKPCAEEILSCSTQVKIINVRVINTPCGCSCEGQKLTGLKAVVIGALVQQIIYIADEETQSVHAAHFTKHFGTYLTLDKHYKKGDELKVNAIVEDVYCKLLDKRNILKNVSIYLGAEENKIN